MTQETLQAQIAQLHQTLQETDSISAETQAMLAQLEADMQPIVAAPETLHHPTLVERLETALANFEADHPRLTLQIQNVINSLSNAGI
ncbi:MAG: DUF4404 family protein [Chloroflexota bacterium]